MTARSLLPFILLFTTINIQVNYSQEISTDPYKTAMDYLVSRGEVYIRIPVTEAIKISALSKIISIDRADKEFIYVYASHKGFEAIKNSKLDFLVETPPSLKINAGSDPYELKESNEFPGSWNQYPSWEEYTSFMKKLATSFPGICLIDTIGFSVNKREILALKISDKVQTDEPEPEFLYTATIHGDEPLGYLLLLRLADYLLNQYGKNPDVTELVDNLQIWINPLSNPDATYFLGNDNVVGSKRFNINDIDLNRNFPDPEDGPHPDGEDYQPETICMMEFMRSRHFVMSANLHSGAELVNYPWDTWAKFHPDDEWYRFISRQYADTTHIYNKQYMQDMVNGITNGFAWYSIAGGRQDWVNYFIHGREITIELSHEKIPSPDTLSWFWEYNYRSLLNYMEQSVFGITGTVKDRITKKPLRTRIEIPGHDSLNSLVWSDSISGKFYRLLAEGFYDIQFSCDGYKDTVLTVRAENYNTTVLDVFLTPLFSNDIRKPGKEIKVMNPFRTSMKISIITPVPERISLNIYDLGGRKALPEKTVTSVIGENIVYVDCASLIPGFYILKIISPSVSYESIVVKSE